MNCAHTERTDRVTTHCTNAATHYIITDRGARVPGVWCWEHAAAAVDEYREKLGWNWTTEPIDEEATDD
jgi:hypothetical protein